MFQDRFELIGRDREIEKAVPARAAFLVDLVETLGQFLVSGFVGKSALRIENRLRESLPNLVTHRLPRKFARRFLKFFPELVIGFLASSETDHGDGGRQFAIGGQIIKRGNEFAMREIAGCAEDNDTARLWHR